MLGLARAAWRRPLLLAAWPILSVLAGCAGPGPLSAARPPSAVALARIDGPVPARAPAGHASRDYPQLASPIDLQAHGYVEHEYFFSGQATRYEIPPDAATGRVLSQGHPYRTRMLVRRPLDATRFNGVVVVEWLNVTAGYNNDSIWQATSEHFMRAGYAYVGISAQRVGVHQPATGLLAWSPTRYAGLDLTHGGQVTDDSLSFDVFAQGARLVAEPSDIDPLAGLSRARTMLAIGSSQSEGRLVNYFNAVHPQHRLFDGYFLYLGTGGRLRTDQSAKVFKLNTENDVLLLGEGRARQPDSDWLRTWEITGASHVGTPTVAIRNPILVRDGLPVIEPRCDRPALSQVPTFDVMPAAFDALERWVRRGVAPPTAERIVLTELGRAATPAAGSAPAVPATPSVAARDAEGIARGGLRLAAVEVPRATNSGYNTGPGSCRLYGSSEAFSPQRLRERYPTPEAYLDAVDRAIQANQRAGHLLAPEAQRARQQARALVGR